MQQEVTVTAPVLPPEAFIDRWSGPIITVDSWHARRGIDARDLVARRSDQRKVLARPVWRIQHIPPVTGYPAGCCQFAQLWAVGWSDAPHLITCNE